jgi:hypothetical protein
MYRSNVLILGRFLYSSKYAPVMASQIDIMLCFYNFSEKLHTDEVDEIGYISKINGGNLCML